MKAERDRLKRLQRLERVRAIAKQAAMVEAAEAESTLAQLHALAERTRLLAADYAGRNEARDGAALRHAGSFARGLHQVYQATAGDAQRARAVADGKMVALGQAERSRAAVEERADRQARHIAKGVETPALGTRKGFGTDLE